MKPSVVINDRDWDIKFELEYLKNTLNKSKSVELEKSIKQNQQLISIIDGYEKATETVLNQNKDFLNDLNSDREELYSCWARIQELDLILRIRYDWNGEAY